MSKAFTKEDAPDEPLVLPTRPSLPTGAPNYVTPRGIVSLRAELLRLSTALSDRDSGGEGVGRAAATREADRPDATSVPAVHSRSARLRELEERIASAIVVDAGALPRDEVRFGARVTVRGETGIDRHYEIVGVDEADAGAGRVAFLAPLARALLGKRVGDVVTFRTPRGEQELEVRAIG